MEAMEPNITRRVDGRKEKSSDRRHHVRLHAVGPWLRLACALCGGGGGGGGGPGPIDSGRLSYDPRVPPGSAGRLEINGLGQ